MSKRRKAPPGRDSTERFVRLTFSLVSSLAWLQIGGSAARIYVELRRRFNGHNNGDLSLSMDEGARILRMSKTTVGKGLHELEDKGFIACNKRGQWYGRFATTYYLTDVSCPRRTATYDYRRWRPHDEEEKQNAVS